MAITGNNMRTQETDEHDFYQTLPCQVKCLCHHLKLGSSSVLDAGAGKGAIANVLREENPAAIIKTAEKNAHSGDIRMPVFNFHDPDKVIDDNTFPAADYGDFFEVTDRFDFVISNPPYFLKNNFIEHGLFLAENVFILLPLMVMNYIEFNEKWLDNERYCGRITMYPKILMNPEGDFMQGGMTGYGWFHWSNLPADPKEPQKYEVIEDIRKFI